MKPLILKLDLEPCSASRPRVSRSGHSYYEKKYKQFKVEAERILSEKLSKLGWDEDHLIDVPMMVHITLVVTQPKKTKLIMPKPDVDNYAKAVLDAATGLIWTDDWLVQILTVRKRWHSHKEGIGYILLEVGDVPA